MAKKLRKKKKNPWLAAILNFLLPCLGYAYAGRKNILVSYGFLIISIVVAIVEWGEIQHFFSGNLTTDFVLYLVAYPIVFGYGGYMDAIKANKSES